MSGLEVLPLHFPPLTEFKIIYEVFASIVSFPTRTMLLAYCCFYSKSSDEFHSLVWPFQNFIGSTCHATSTESNHLHSPCPLIVMRKFNSENFFYPRNAILLKKKKKKNSHADYNLFKLSIAIYSPYHNLHRIYLPLTFISHILLYFEWHSNLVLS